MKNVAIAALAGIGFALVGCSRPLPEAESPAAKTYAANCNQCHRIYQPGLMTEKMWETMVERMETEMTRNGTPLAAGDKAVILEYLKRHAAKS